MFILKVANFAHLLILIISDFIMFLQKKTYFTSQLTLLHKNFVPNINLPYKLEDSNYSFFFFLIYQLNFSSKLVELSSNDHSSNSSNFPQNMINTVCKCYCFDKTNNARMETISKICIDPRCMRS